MFEAPSDSHRHLGLVAHILRRSEEMERAIVFFQAREEHDARAAGNVSLITSAGRTVRTRRGLALPVDELAANRIIAVASGWREPTAGFIECEDQDVTL